MTFTKIFLSINWLGEHFIEVVRASLDTKKKEKKNANSCIMEGNSAHFFPLPYIPYFAAQLVREGKNSSVSLSVCLKVLSLRYLLIAADENKDDNEQ